jgi:hypothetical protein
MNKSVSLLRIDKPLMVIGGPYSNLEAIQAILNQAACLEIPPDRINKAGRSERTAKAIDPPTRLWGTDGSALPGAAVASARALQTTTGVKPMGSSPAMMTEGIIQRPYDAASVSLFPRPSTYDAVAPEHVDLSRVISETGKKGVGVPRRVRARHAGAALRQLRGSGQRSSVLLGRRDNDISSHRRVRRRMNFRALGRCHAPAQLALCRITARASQPWFAS